MGEIPMAIMTPNAKQIPVKIVGSSIFGRHPIISDERTWNMFISDNWMVNFAGYNVAANILSEGIEGRGLFHSTRGNFLLAVLGSNIYRIDINLGWTFLLSLRTSSGEVFMDENLSSQIMILDGSVNGDGSPHAYIYNYNPTVNAVGVANFTGTPQHFIPNYVTYQNTYFVFGNGATDASGSQWYVYKTAFNPASPSTAFDIVWVQTLTLQTKPDFAKACIRIPSKGNNLLVMGSTVCEIWTNLAGIQIYQRQSSINIDYGVASVSTIAASDDMIAWLGINEKSSPAIMVMTGGQAQRLSTDGIDYLLSLVKFPAQSTAMFYRQDGHVFYILTFFNPEDNFSIIYDFNTKKFFDITDWNFNYHPARQIAYFGNEIYFVSLNQGALMHFSTDLVTISTNPDNEYEIPRIRKCDTFRLPGSDRFIVNQFAFTVQNGVDPNITTQTNIPRIDVTISKNGGVTYGNVNSYYMHTTGNYFNQPRFHKLGQANQFTIQMRFWGFDDVTISDGVLEVYQ